MKRSSIMMHASTSNAMAQPGRPSTLDSAKDIAVTIGVADFGKSQAGVTVSAWIYIYIYILEFIYVTN